MSEWAIHYADGSIDRSVWDEKSDVVALVVYGGERKTKRGSDSVVSKYRTLFYEDLDDVDERESPPFYFWRTLAGKFGAGYSVPRGARAKLGARVQEHDDEHSDVFAAIDSER